MSDNGAPAAYQPGPPVRVTLDLPADIVRALDAWAARQREPVKRHDAILRALQDWLVELGNMPAKSDVAEGLQ